VTVPLIKVIADDSTKAYVVLSMDGDAAACLNLRSIQSDGEVLEAERIGQGI
jgi:hypothetical protein